LDFLGFPWILSSESRLFNGLQGLEAARSFRGAFGGLSTAGTGRRAFALDLSNDRIVHEAKLTNISD
jgi:hypothetical protein